MSMERGAGSRSICILTIAAAWGGAERHTVDLACALAARGHRVRLVELGAPVFHDRHELVDAGVEVITIPVGDRVKRTPQGWWRALLDRLAADIVVLAKGAVTVGSLRLDRAAVANGRGYVTIEHGQPAGLPARLTRRARGRVPWIEWERPRRRLRYWRRSLMPTRIVCVSDAIRRTLTRTYRFPEARTCVARNGIDVARFVPDATARAAARRHWGVPDECIVIGAAARLDPLKGLDELITTFARIHARHPGRDIRLVIVGEGPAESLLHGIAARSGAPDAIVFAGPTRTPDAVIPGFDVFALPSHVEGLPLALLEAMACCVPPVCYAVGGVGEVVTHPSHGRLIPSRDHAAFERALEEIVLLPAEAREALGRAARERVVTAFDARECMGRLAALVETTPTRA